MFKLLSLNTHKFFNHLNTSYTLKPLKEFLEKVQCDIVFLQEVRGVHPKKMNDFYTLDPLEFLADELWDHYVYGKNAVYNLGHHGNAILSKYPILEWKNFDISNHKLEKRSLLYCKIHAGGGEVHLFCTHLDLSQWGRNRQLRKIRQIISELVDPRDKVILSGDFNDWNKKIDQNLRDDGFSRGRLVKTYPVFFPMLELDRIYFKNLQLEDEESCPDFESEILSDHLPLIVKLNRDENEV